MSARLDVEAAKELLLLHSFRHADLEHPKVETGFLGSLRPYRGLREENYREVMASLRTLAPLLGAKKVDREVVSALWAICFFARAWGIHPEGMLRRNKLISKKDVAKLEQWIETIGYATNALLDGSGVEQAFSVYRTGKGFP